MTKAILSVCWRGA